MEERQCQNCKQKFCVEPDDFLFYEKIKVPPPTWCPECRFIRRQAFHDMFKLYKRICDLCKKEFISRYSQDKPYTVYCPACWWSDGWDPLDYGRAYDFSRPFFAQYSELIRAVPQLGLSVTLDVALNSPYNNHAGDLKQCYLTFDGDFNERCMYGYFVSQSKDCVESSFTGLCELGYDLFHGFKNYNCIYLDHSIMSSDSAFLWQCSSVQNCFASANLRNKQYYFFNMPCTKEEYQKKIQEIDLGSYRVYTETKERARSHWLRYPAKTFWHEFSRDTSGLYVFESKNCQRCFEVTGAEDCKFVTFIYPAFIQDSYDVTSFGFNIQLVYDSLVVGYGANDLKFADESGMGLFHSSYVKTCISGSSYLFGCASMKDKKSYCILNKQYSEEEYHKLVSKIIQHMHEMPYRDKGGREYRYGEFLPIELSPFAYNETLAHYYYPLTKEEALEKGYTWKDEETHEYIITISAHEIPDHIRVCTDQIAKETVGCAACGRGYRITLQEIEFYRKMNVPLPRNCFYCRLAEKLKDQPHPMRFWNRKCQCEGLQSAKSLAQIVYQNQAKHFHGSAPCPNEFETSYAPERPEIVYCEECYQQEVV